MSPGRGLFLFFKTLASGGAALLDRPIDISKNTNIVIIIVIIIIHIYTHTQLW